MSEITVCIPTYEYRGDGVTYLAELFDSLARQTFTDFDVIISDHSKDDVIMEWCKHCHYDFEITYIQNPNGRGLQSTNTNCAIENAEGKIVKLIYQDDFFVDEDALQKIHDAFTPGVKWLFHGFTHSTDGREFHRPCSPKWTSTMLLGDNLLGSPSCTAYLNGTYLGMDEDMKLLIDTELYHRMRMKHGMPAIIDDVLIANREHDNRVSAGGIDYDAVISTEDGSRQWMVNRREVSHIQEKHQNFFVNQKYPDED